MPRTLCFSLCIAFFGLAYDLPAEPADGNWMSLWFPGEEVTALAVDPTDPDVIYVCVHREGLFKTVDRGRSWNQIGEGAWIEGLPPTPEFSFLIVCASDPRILYGIKPIGLFDGIYRSADGGHTWAWELKGKDLALAVAPGDPDVLYSFARDDRLGDGTLELSKDGGATWTDELLRMWPAGGLARVFSVAVHPEDSKIAYMGGRPPLYDPPQALIVKTVDGGKTWGRVLTVGPFAFPRKGTFPVIRIAPRRPDTVYFVLGDPMLDTGWEIWKTADGGGSVERISEVSGKVRDLYLDPRDENRLYLLTDRDVLQSEDGAATWRSIGEGLAGLEVRSIAVTGDALYAATSGGVFVRWMGRLAPAFTDVAGHAGVAKPPGRSAVVADYDDDGYLDLFVAGGAGESVLFRNRGDGTFGRALSLPSYPGVEIRGAAFGDYDRDGDLDLYLVRGPVGATNLLLRNKGDGTFGDVSSAAGVGHAGDGQAAAFGDYDRDGDPDLYVTNRDADNVLYRNEGDGTFRDGTIQAGVVNRGRGGLAPTFLDYDNDGDLDLLVVNVGRSGTVLYRNNGRGFFANVSGLSGLVGVEAMRATVGDYDNDGDLDIHLMGPEGNALYRNKGDGTFADATEAAGIDRTLRGSGSAFGDWDNDGDLDLLVAGWVYDNVGNGTFRRIARIPGEGGTPPVFFDYDNDGDLDLFVSQLEGQNALLRNDAAVGSYLTVRIVPARSVDLRARVRVVSGDHAQLREADGCRTVHFGLGDAVEADSVIVRWPSGETQILTDVSVNQTLMVREPFLARDVGIVALLSPKPIAPVGRPVFPTVRIRNHGSERTEAFDARCRIEFEGALVYEDVQFVRPLESGDTTDVSFAAWTASVSGRYRLTFSVHLPSDEDASNDTLEISLRAVIFVEATTDAGLEEVGGRALAFGDYDGDGDSDLYLSRDGPNRLFLNAGDGTFSPVVSSGAEDDGQGQTALWGDWDNDGDLDLYVVNYYGRTDGIYRNEGGGRFVEVTASSEMSGDNYGRGGAVGDWDNDGDLDVYVTRAGWNKLYVNRGNGAFREAAGATGVAGVWRLRGGVSSGDYDDDGDTDLFVANGRHSSPQFDRCALFRNEGNGTFTDVTDAAGVNREGAWMIGVFGDYDNDGDLDLFVGAFEGESVLYRNNGDGTFTGEPFDGGLVANAAFGDYDNDGDLDLLVVKERASSVLYRNDGGRFVEERGASAPGDLPSGWAGAFEDYDDDGDLDLFVLGEKGLTLYRNTGNVHHWLHVETVGTISNRQGIGAQIQIVSGRARQRRDVGIGSGHLSQEGTRVEFGLGAHASADTLRIRWPDGAVQLLTDLPADHRIVVREPAGERDLVMQAVLLPDTLMAVTVPFAPSCLVRNAGPSEEHEVEVRCTVDSSGVQIYSDATRIPLLPGLGSGTAVFRAWTPGDVGKYTFTFRVHLPDDARPGNNVLRRTALAAVTFTNVAKEAGVAQRHGPAAFLDYDLDGDLDFHAARSLYRNEGDGTFTDVGRDAGVFLWGGESVLPAVGDYDNDGDPDIYGFYPERRTLRDMILRNNGNGTFEESDLLLGRAIAVSEGAHLTTDAVWFDYDNDGYLDLFLAGVTPMSRREPFVLWRNEEGRAFVDVSADVGITDWPIDEAGVCALDYDDDGDLDVYMTRWTEREDDNRLYRNEEDGTFADVAETAGVLYGGRVARPAFGDYDNDGDFDLYLTAFRDPNVLYRNNGDGTFTDVSEEAGFGVQRGGGTAVFGDYDNDGDLDLLLGDRLYSNNGDGAFTDVSARTGFFDEVRGLHPDTRRSSIFADYDNDGDLDIYTTVYFGALLRNNGTPNHWLAVRTVGTKSNRDGVGAKVTVVSGDLVQLRQVGGTPSESPRVHFGLGDRTSVDSLIVRWPSGIVDVIRSSDVDRVLTVREGSTEKIRTEVETESAVPPEFALRQNHPNPFNAETTITYDVAKTNTVRLSVYTLTGQHIRTLVDGERPAGSYSVTWDGKDDVGRDVASGVYLCRMESGDHRAVRKMLMVR